MSQIKALQNLLKTKADFIITQRDKLHGALDVYVSQITSKVTELLETREQNVKTLTETSLVMETVLLYLMDIVARMEDGAMEPLSTDTDLSTDTTSSLPPLTDMPTATSTTKLSDTDSEQLSKLHRHMEVLEIALTTCRNEISQANTDKNEVRDKLDKLENHIQKVETSHSQGLEQHEEKLASLEKLTQQTQSNMTNEIKDLQKTFKDNIKRTKQELNAKMNNVDEEFQKTQEENMTTIKEQASKLGKVEKKLKKMKEEEQERSSQIDSIHKDVESLKDDQKNNQQLVKIQGLEKHMETLTSQCDSLQDQVEKIEPVIQMSQELTHKISILATDEQVQELIQTTTATSRSLEELTSKIEDTERSVRGCVAQRERDENRKREMEDRVAVLEARRQQDLDHYTKELEETNSLYKAVCQLVDQRVTPLRRLQRMLNDYHKHVEKREEISTRLDDVVKKVEDISTHLDTQERSVVPARVGFTAYYNGLSVPSVGSRITDFTNVICNEGNHYNPFTGEFICPKDGLYLVSATLWQSKDGEVDIHIKCQSGNTATPIKVACRVNTKQSDTSSCSVAVVKLTTGEKIYVEVMTKSGDAKLLPYSSFSSVLVA